jgi:hypothetical protein
MATTKVGGYALAMKPLRRSAEDRRLPLGSLLIVLLMVASATPTVHAQLNTFESRFYKVHTPMSPRQVKPLAHHMDVVFAHYKKRFKNFDPRNNKLQPLFMFETRQQYVKFMQQHGFNAKNSGGMFFVSREIRGLATWATGRSKERVFGVLQHEGFHQFAWNYIGPNLPQWVNEGLAQYFEDAKIQGRHIELGQPDRRRVRRLEKAARDNELMSLQRVITLSNEQWNQVLNSSQSQGSVMYAQAWSMVFFLIHGDGERYQDAFKQYLHILADGKSNKQAVEAAFQTNSFRAMHRRWVNFLKTRLFN